MRFLILFLFIFFCSCREHNKHLIDPKARLLNDRAATIIRNTNDYEKGIALYDEAIKIDSEYLVPVKNKLLCQITLKQYQNALKTASKLHKMRPEAPDYFVIIGILYENLRDSINSKIYFNNALPYYDRDLDTIKKGSYSYETHLLNKALDLILVGQEQEGNQIIKKLYEKQTDEIHKYSFSVFMNKPRQFIIEHYFLRIPPAKYTKYIIFSLHSFDSQSKSYGANYNQAQKNAKNPIGDSCFA